MPDARTSPQPDGPLPPHPRSILLGDPASDAPGARVALVAGPVLAIALAWYIVGLFTTREIANEALAAGGVFLTFVGPAVIFGPAIMGTNVFEHLTTFGLVATTAFFTCATAFFYTFNFDLLERLPRIGPWIRGVRASMEETLAAKPWIRRFALFGVGFFVLLPLPGSGTLGGSIVGRLVGLSRWASFLAVSLGGVLVCFLYGWFGESLLRFGEAHRLSMPAKIGGAAAFLVVVTLLGRLLGRRRRAPAAGP